MTRGPRPVPALWLGLLFVCPSVHAAPEEVLFLGLQHRGGTHERAGRTVLRRLERLGERAASPERLSPVERACRTEECLSALATARRVQWILSGELRQNQARDYSLSLWLYDVRARRLLEEGITCEACDDDALGNAAATAAGRLFEQRNRGAVAPAEEARRVTPPPPESKLPVEVGSRKATAVEVIATAPPAPPRKGSRIAAAAVLGGLGLAALATVIAAATVPIEGPCGGTTVPHSTSVKCDWSPGTIVAGSAVAAGALGAGLYFTLKFR